MEIREESQGYCCNFTLQAIMTSAVRARKNIIMLYQVIRPNFIWIRKMMLNIERERRLELTRIVLREPI